MCNYIERQCNDLMHSELASMLLKWQSGSATSASHISGLYRLTFN